MASAVLVQQDYVVKLLLSQDEAEALRSVFGLVGGHPEFSDRGYIDNIREALDAVGVESSACEVNGSIYFKAE